MIRHSFEPNCCLAGHLADSPDQADQEATGLYQIMPDNTKIDSRFYDIHDDIQHKCFPNPPGSLHGGSYISTQQWTRIPI